MASEEIWDFREMSGRLGCLVKARWNFEATPSGPTSPFWHLLALIAEDSPLVKVKNRSSLVAQQAVNPALSLLWPRSLLWHRFDPWPQHLLMFQVGWKKKKRFEDHYSDPVGQKNLSGCVVCQSIFLPDLRIPFSGVFQERHRH